MQKFVHIFSGEGTRSRESGFRLIKSSPLFAEVDGLVSDICGSSLEEMWNEEADLHRAPKSPMVTVASQICLSGLWDRWGYTPDMVIGHSIGELTAAWKAGFYSLEDILQLTWSIGKVTGQLEGAMAHGTVSEQELASLNGLLAARNFTLDAGIHVTFSGLKPELDAFLAGRTEFHSMQPPHPWHYHGYSDYLQDLQVPAARKGTGPLFVSGVTGGFVEEIDADHWQRWLTTPMNYFGGVDGIAKRIGETPAVLIEIGFHPVLETSARQFVSATYVSTMFRGEDEFRWVLYQRGKLDQNVFIEKVQEAVEGYRPGVDSKEPLSYQGFSSLAFLELTDVLAPFFPGLAPQDFYRFKSLEHLLTGFGRTKSETGVVQKQALRNDVVIAGMSCRLPASAESPLQFWQDLLSGEDKVRGDNSRGGFEAGFLSQRSSRFDHRFFRISEAEVRTMDPQQILALELTEELFRDAGIDPEALDKRRVGVYIGAWNDEYHGDRHSVYYPTGTNPSIIASRISYHYDLRGPSWVVNTACSSSLVALHYACKDIEAGRVDYAIAGGVNLILGEDFTKSMGDSGFLSRDQRCKAFDDSANGYVRSEGGGLVLLVNRDLVKNYYAQVIGSAINQNGGRPQVITAPHPEAQEELIFEACRDAGISPATIDYVECHGTGTKIGDPIEFSALQNSVARDRTKDCLLGAVKSNIGHLESAAGIAGLVKSVLSLYHGLVPANLHFNKPNQFIDFAGQPLKVVAQPTPLGHESIVGVSSFGFGGANGHMLLRGAPDAERKVLQERPSPFDRDRGAPITNYFQLGAEVGLVSAPKATVAPALDIRALVGSLFTEVTGVTELDSDVELTDQGLDSLNATQFISSLQEKLGVEIDTDLLFDNPLPEQLVAALEKIAGSGQAKAAGDGGASWDEDSIRVLVGGLFTELTGVTELDPDVELTDQGLDSLSATQFISSLQEKLGVELDTDLLFDNPLPDQLIAALAKVTGGSQKEVKGNSVELWSNEKIMELVAALFTDVTGVTELEMDVELTDQGLDSLSATQFISSLQERLGVEIDTDLLFDNPLPEQLVDALATAAGQGD